jgi:hypothetical protein
MHKEFLVDEEHAIHHLFDAGVDAYHSTRTCRLRASGGNGDQDANT